MATKTFYTNKDAVMGKQVSGGTFSGWNGKDDHLQVGKTSNYKWRAVVYFPISFSGMIGITGARLHLKTYAGTGGGVHQPQLTPPSQLNVRRMTSDWGEGDVNPGEGDLTGSLPWEWDNRATNYTSDGHVEKSIDQGTTGSDEFIDVTDIVKAWFDGRPNYGFILINENETTAARALLFYAREFDSDHRPSLVIDYDTNTPPNAPVSLTPTGGSVTSMTPTFNFTRSDPDVGDYISGYMIEVYNNAGTVLHYGTPFIPTTGTPTSASHIFGSAASTANPVIPLTDGQTYKWRVKTWDSEVQGGAFSAYQTFVPNAPPSAPTVTVTSAPVNDINDSTPSFVISHNDAGNANMYGYQFIITDTSIGAIAFDSGNIDKSGSPSPTVSVSSSTLTFGRPYTIKARTQDNHSVWSVFSANVAFTLHKAQAPTNMDPTGNETTNTTPVLTGDRGSSTDVITAVWIRVYTDDLASTPLPATRYTSTIEPGGTGFSVPYAGSALGASVYYRWQAQVETSSGDISDWSATQRFFVADATTPSLTAPAGTGIASLTPTFSGQRATTFNRFKYELYAANGTTLLYASASLSATISGSGPYLFSSVYGGAPALAWATQYKWRAAVSADAGSSWSPWSGLMSFTTSSAGVAVHHTPTANQWITDATPDFLITRSGSDTIDQMQVRVYNASQVLLWDSGMIDVTNGTSGVGPITYAGATLTGGDYYWDARYKSAAGPTGPYSGLQKFRLNRAPTIPTNLFPTPNYVFADTLLPTFRATFQDPDKETNGDYPNGWDIDILNSSGTVLATKTITAGLTSGTNEYEWTGGDYALSYGTQYMWRTRFRDSNSAWGAYSASSNFKAATSPNGTITTPSNESTVASINPTVEWSFTGGTQSQYRLRVVRVLTGAVVYDTTPPVPSAATSAQVNYLRDGWTYDITLTVWNTDGLEDPTPSTVQVIVALDAPDPISGLSITTSKNDSYVQLDWDQGGLKTNHTFIRYQIYRRVKGDVSWYEVGEARSRTQPRYIDWTAGNSISYEYRVTQVDTKTAAGIELESPDGDENIVPVIADADVWMFIGFDRASAHIIELPVVDEDHNRPVQQEEFEPLGSDRKVIMRGFVLGHEGSIQCIFRNDIVPSPDDFQVLYNETLIGRRLVDYLTRNKGPHILKSPFGDVWDVEFQGPTYKWLDSGNLQVTLTWIETGNTSQVVV
jgi:hypothetical protein